jgi:two-component system, chemotaxis family, response regulator Rcp1
MLCSASSGGLAIKNSTPEILLVDDNPADVVLVRESLAETAHQSHVHFVVGADEAIAFLRQRGRYTHTVRPDLMILDLNLPNRDGHRVLAEVRALPELSHIPVVVFSSSASQQDIARSYELGANCYVSKPGDLKRFFSAVRAIEEFWFRYASLPQKENNERATRSRFAD